MAEPAWSTGGTLSTTVEEDGEPGNRYTWPHVVVLISPAPR